MKRNVKFIVILVIILAIVGGIFGVVMGINSNNKKKSESIANNLTIMSFDDSSMTKIKIVAQDKQEYDIEKSGDKWTITNRDDIILYEYYVTELSNYISNLTATKNLGAVAKTDYSSYGLDNPTTITVTDADGDHTFYLGNATSTKESYYVQKQDRVNLFTIDYDTGNFIANVRQNMRSPILSQGIDYDEIGYVKIEADGKTVVEGDRTANSSWEIIAPKKMDADLGAFTGLVSNIADYEADDFGKIDPSEKYLKKQGFDNPYYKMTIKTFDGTELEFEVAKKVSDADNDKSIEVYYPKLNMIILFPGKYVTFLNSTLTYYASLTLFSGSGPDYKEFNVDFTDDLNIKADLTYDVDSENNSYTNVKLNGKDYDTSSDDTKTNLDEWFTSVLYLEATDTDVYAKPSGKAVGEISLTKTDGTKIDYTFVPRDDDTYYIIKDGDYSGLVINKKAFNQDSGVSAQYKNLIKK